MKMIQCSGLTGIYGQLGEVGGVSLSLNLFSVVVLHGFMVN